MDASKSSLLTLGVFGEDPDTEETAEDRPEKREAEDRDRLAIKEETVERVEVETPWSMISNASSWNVGAKG